MCCIVILYTSHGMQMSIKLVNGVMLPELVFGTDIVGDWRRASSIFRRGINKYRYEKQLYDRDQYRRVKLDKSFEHLIDTAISSGITGFDTSRAYGGSEFALGNVIKKYNRKDLFIISKVSNADQREIGAKEALERSLDDLKTDYIDLYLLHWPQPDTFLNNWLQLEEIYKNTNKCKAIGVCNCKKHHIELLRKKATILPMVNEIEVHPLLTEKELCEYCIDNKIGVLSYTSTARMDDRLVESTRIKNICKKYEKTYVQIILKWHIQRGRTPIFNTSNSKHLINNVKDLNFRIESEDLDIIDGMNINSRLRFDSDNCDYDIL